jgi:4-hydroxy-tetrahydrodipicolinate reductase
VSGVPATRGAAVGDGAGVQVHALRLPSYILSCEALFGLPDERLTIRHDAGSSAAPYVAGTLLAIRRVAGIRGLVRGLDSLID